MKYLIIFALLCTAYAQDERCPEIGEDGEAHYFPHESDCALFWSCDEFGNSQLHSCEFPLEFNPILMVCDWPLDGGCDLSIAPTTTTTTEPPTTTTTEAPTTTTEEPTTTTTTEEPTTTTTEEPTTTTTEEPTTEEPTTTTTEEPTTTTTEAPTTTTTEEPTTTTTTPEPTTTTTTTEEPTTTTSSTTSGPVTPSGECPEVDDAANPIHFPYHGDCTRFFKCFNGEPTVQDCPAGLHFGVEIDRCDYPEIARCEESVAEDMDIFKQLAKMLYFRN